MQVQGGLLEFHRFAPGPDYGCPNLPVYRPRCLRWKLCFHLCVDQLPPWNRVSPGCGQYGLFPVYDRQVRRGRHGDSLCSLLERSVLERDGSVGVQGLSHWFVSVQPGRKRLLPVQRRYLWAQLWFPQLYLVHRQHTFRQQWSDRVYALLSWNRCLVQPHWVRCVSCADLRGRRYLYPLPIQLLVLPSLDRMQPVYRWTGQQWNELRIVQPWNRSV